MSQAKIYLSLPNHTHRLLLYVPYFMALPESEVQVVGRRPVKHVRYHLMTPEYVAHQLLQAVTAQLLLQPQLLLAQLADAVCRCRYCIECQQLFRVIPSSLYFWQHFV